MVIFLLVVFFVFPVVFNFTTRSFLNPYKLHFIFGKKGSGKSTRMVQLMVHYLKKGWSVYTDMTDICLPGVRIIDPSMLGDYVPTQNSALFLDEAGILFDNRNFKAFKPSLRDFFKLQRHYRCVVYMNSQSFDVDKKIRDLTDYMYLQVNLFRVFSVGKRIDRKVALVQSSSQGDSRIAEDLKFSPFWTWTWTFIPKYTKYFKSFRVPDLPELSYSEIASDAATFLDPRVPSQLRNLFKKGKFEK